MMPIVLEMANANPQTARHLQIPGMIDTNEHIPSSARTWRYLPASLGLVILLFVTAVCLYAYVVHPAVGFDASAHINYVNYLRKEARRPPLDHDSLAFSYELVQQPPLYYALAALASAALPYQDADVYTRRSENPYFGTGQATRWSIPLPDAPAAYRASLELARAVSAFGGLLAVVATWLWVNALLPGRPWLAAAAACLVGLNPLFLFLSVTVTNDTWAVAGAAVTIWLVTAMARRAQFSLWRWFVVGCVAGLAALTKYNVLLVAVPALVVLLLDAQRIGYRRLAAACGALLAGAMATAGFWYIGNWVNYGEPVPVAYVARTLGILARPAPLPWNDVVAKLPWLFYSYWGVFLNIVSPPGYLDFCRWFAAIGFLGLGLYLVQGRREKWRAGLISLLWFGATFASFISWMRFVSFGDQVRLLMTAAPAIALLLVLGWNAWLGGRRHATLNVALMAVSFVMALWSLPTIARHLAVPAPLPDTARPARPLDVRLANGLQILGFDLPQGAALLPGKALPLTLYFGTDRVLAEDYTLFIHLVDEDHNLLYQFDGVPFAGRYPTRQWSPGIRFADPYSLTVQASREEVSLATLEMGLYKIGRPAERLAMFDPAGKRLGDRLVLGKIRVLDRIPLAGDAAPAALATWAGQISLLSAVVDDADGTYRVSLAWQTAQPLQTDYTVFVQLLDADRRVVGQIDQQPRGGQAPTSAWAPGETITDSLHLAVPDRDWQQMVLGLYDATTGSRLALSAPLPGDDVLVLRSR